MSTYQDTDGDTIIVTESSITLKPANPGRGLFYPVASFRPEDREAIARDILGVAGDPQSVINDIITERQHQNEKWGEQNHPDGTGEHSTPLSRITYSERTAAHLQKRAKMSTDGAARRGQVAWTDILLEEVFEALAEDDPIKLRKELIQVAAVATQWAEAIDRRGT